MVENMLFFEKGIKNARLATLTRSPPPSTPPPLPPEIPKSPPPPPSTDAEERRGEKWGVCFERRRPPFPFWLGRDKKFFGCQRNWAREGEVRWLLQERHFLGSFGRGKRKWPVISRNCGLPGPNNCCAWLLKVE